MSNIEKYSWRGHKIELNAKGSEFVGITIDDDTRLTLKQLQILSLKSMGMEQQEIADSLGVTLQTIKNHLQYAKTANSGEYDQKLTVMDLIAICEEVDLLLPITVLGIESINKNK